MKEVPEHRPDDAIKAAAQEFVEAQLRGEAPDLEAFLQRHGSQKESLRQILHDCNHVGDLLDSLRSVDVGEFSSEFGDFNLLGQRIASFEVTEVLGRGGMGIVYKAHDTRLDRPVAVKAMPAHLARDAVACARFRREAQILASMNHPRIGIIHDVVERDDGTCLLILEYIAGPTLAQWLRDKHLPIRDALLIALQIAEALVAAFDKGIIHRDLKPGNIKVGSDGQVKVLDFGIAKTVPAASEPAGPALTRQGRLLGTPAYMSPEQTRGQPLDHRTDIWAFGCILYEMLTGHMAFAGETVSDTIARVLERAPDWRALPANLPANIEVLLRRCLEKEQCDRLQHIGDAVVEIRETLDPPAIAPPPQQRPGKAARPRPAALMASAPILVLLGLALGLGLARRSGMIGSDVSAPTRFAVPRQTSHPGVSLLFPSLALSPDGRTLAYVAEDTDGRRRIFLRRLDTFDAPALAGTEGATSPFFSPDGQWIAYDDHYNRKLKKVAVGGGVPVTLAEAPDFRGGTWTADGRILFAPDTSDGLFSVPASGGPVQRLTTPDPNRGESAHLWPQILPDDRHVLFTARGRPSHLEVLDPDTGNRHVLIETGAYARADLAGHLLYARNWSLYAVDFDTRKLSLSGPHRVVATEVWQSTMGTSQFAVAANGVLATIGGKWDTMRLQPVCVTPDGRRQALSLSPRNYHELRVAPDGSRLALCAYTDGASDIWVHDTVHGTTADISGDGKARNPVWAGTDNAALFYQTSQGLRCWTGEGQEPTIWGRVPHLSKVCDGAPDGRHLLIQLTDPNGFAGWPDIAVVALAAEGDPTPVLFDRAVQGQRRAVWSPCERWIAYESDESGRQEIYVKPYPGPGPRVCVTPDGGREPLWAPDTSALYYRHRHKVMAVRIATDPEFKVLETRALFDDDYYSCARCRTWDMMPDGRFVMLDDLAPSDNSLIRITLNAIEPVAQSGRSR